MSTGFGVDPVALTRAHGLLRAGSGSAEEMGRGAPSTPDGGDATAKMAHLLAALSGATARYSADLDSMADHLLTALDQYGRHDDDTAAALGGDSTGTR